MSIEGDRFALTILPTIDDELRIKGYLATIMNEATRVGLTHDQRRRVADWFYDRYRTDAP